jgi:hypothetical protein
MAIGHLNSSVFSIQLNKRSFTSITYKAYSPIQKGDYLRQQIVVYSYTVITETANEVKFEVGCTETTGRRY